MADARFEDGTGEPLRLCAESAEDLAVLSALVQDAVVHSSDMSWMKRRHRFAMLVNRFRWEDKAKAEQGKRAYERVRSTLMVCGVLKVSASGIDPADRSLILSLLSVGFEPGEDGTGSVLLIFAGDGEIRLDVECLDIMLTDVTRPYKALSGHAPAHEPG